MNPVNWAGSHLARLKPKATPPAELSPANEFRLLREFGGCRLSARAELLA
jgi:hypothetical protein